MLFSDRLKCPYSYGSEETPHLLCSIDGRPCSDTEKEHCGTGVNEVYDTFDKQMDFLQKLQKRPAAHAFAEDMRTGHQISEKKICKRREPSWNIFSDPLHKEDSYCIDKEAWIKSIVETCSELKAEDKLTVNDFGKTGSRMLVFYKDPDFHGGEMYNIVRITVYGGEEPYDTDDIHVSELAAELETIWEEGIKDYDMVLFEKPLSEGLTVEDMNALTKLFDNNNHDSFLLVDFDEESSAAMGFIDFTMAEILSFEYDGLEVMIREILNDMEKENENGEYEFAASDGREDFVFKIKIIR